MDPIINTFVAISIISLISLIGAFALALTLSVEQWPTITLELTENVLRTLEIAHLDPLANVLVDRSAPTLNGWIREEGGSLVNLGLLASAFDHVLATFGDNSEIGARVLALLTAEISFLQVSLADSRGGSCVIRVCQPGG